MEKKYWFVSDTHFGHIKDFLWNPRGFNSIQEHDETIIHNWNEIIRPEDEVYHLGDVMLNDNEHGLECIKKLNGKIHLIIGNHDKEVLKKCRSYFISVDYYKKIYDNNKAIILCHYPMAEWDGMFRQTYHIYGHIHNALNDTYYIMKNRDLAFNAGCMINNYVPVTLNELIQNNQIFKQNN